MQDSTIPTPGPSDAAPAPDTSNTPTPAPYKSEVCVLGSTLKEGDTMPAEGDEVDLEVKGTVSRIVGDTVCVSPETVNGEPAPPSPPPEPENAAETGAPGEEMDAQRQQLLAGAMQQDAQDQKQYA